jgi:putative hydroxymethylpyrimidine transport system ATP-binding protein
MIPTVNIRDAYLQYQKVVLFDHLNLTLKAGQLTGLLGPSGVGKSSLLRLIANLITANKEQIIRAMITTDNATALTSEVAYLAQQDSLLPWFTAWDNALLGAKLRGEVTYECKERAKDLFQQVGLEKAKKKYPHQLSGGMRQRVALVRTLLEDKPIVLMDEPFASLDAITRFQLQALTATLLRGRTVFLVTHDPLEALRLANEIYILSGQPATLTLATTLSSATPRDLADPSILSLQAALFHQLTAAKGSTV